MHTNLGKEGFLLAHIFMPQAIIEASEDRNLKKQPKEQAEAIKEYCLLACSSWLTEPVFFYTTQDYLQWAGLSLTNH